ncbi:hypothetical protein MKW98_023717 [Papaver atlanticum]|uniref:FYVE-type domain-containing protein n=1 Tax=Papaver atlanticum TaxID=357466 RepID=A0AAD4XNB8_9MAGN|nr:hypothetical protein MKW98_023717 [Papaver atlanticum]
MNIDSKLKTASDFLKHHCRRCGGIFCGSCTQQRMLLRGQGDSPVRMCDPCKKRRMSRRGRRGVEKRKCS